MSRVYKLVMYFKYTSKSNFWETKNNFILGNIPTFLMSNHQISHPIFKRIYKPCLKSFIDFSLICAINNYLDKV